MSAFGGFNQNDASRIVDSGGDELAILADGSINVNAAITATSVEISNDLGNAIPVVGSTAEDTPSVDGGFGIPTLGVRNDAAAAKTSADGDYGMISLDSAGRVGIADLGGTISIDDGAGSITVDGTVTVGTLPGSLAGKAEDSAAASGDVGLPILGVRNDTLATLTSADGDYGMVALDGQGRQILTPDVRLPIAGYQNLTIPAASTALTVPSGAKRALIQCESADVRWRDDGTAPTATVGMRLDNGSSMEYTGDLAAIRFIRRTGSSGTINVSYYDR
jgi:hypothetical protein